MFDYSHITPRAFERLAKEYLEITYEECSWTLTDASGDGNKDVVCRYRFLDQEFEYWAEAKFSKEKHPAKLKKGQLDPTLVSALLHPRHVSIKFISNNDIPDSYIYRITDFQLRTNIGVTLILKDKFEAWLLEHPEICSKYGIITSEGYEHEIDTVDTQVKINSILVTGDNSESKYSLERKIIQKQQYYVYLLIDSNVTIKNISIRFLRPEFTFLVGSGIVHDPENFCISEGVFGYKFCFMPTAPFSGKMPVALSVDEHVLLRTYLPDITVIRPQEYALAYAQQSKYEAELIQFVKTAGNKNQIAVISGQGASGKSYLMTNVLRKLALQYETAHYVFSESESYNCLQLCMLILFLNIGNLEGYSYTSILEATQRLTTPDKRLFLSELLLHISDAPSKCVEFMSLKQRQGNLQMLFAKPSRSRKVVVLEDIHKLCGPVKELFVQVLSEFVELENNQVLLCATRGETPLFLKYSYIKCLDGLTRQDKEVTLRRYLGTLPDTINFHRATDNALVFSNILSRLIDEKEGGASDTLTFKTHVRRYCEHIETESTLSFQAHLAKYTAYSELIELVFWIQSGVDYQILAELFPTDTIDALIADKVFKLVGAKVMPIHDLYVEAFFKNRTICQSTTTRLQALMEIDPENRVLYLSLLLNSNNTVFFSQLSLARNMRDSYFSKTMFYESFLLAQAIVSHINFSEQLSADDIIDTFVLATSSFYQKDCDEVIDLYKLVLQHGWRYKTDPKIWGVLLRTKTELMNQYYWDLKLELLEEELNDAERTFPDGAKYQDSEIRFACIHRYNRRMALELLQNRYTEADADFKYCCLESQRLERPASEGFAEMDYAKGLYNIQPKSALLHMERALEIFQRLGTEYRRHLDCACEVAYLRCLLDGGTPDSLYELECSALALHEAHYEELYSKAKLKLVALHMCFGAWEPQQIESDLIEAEYVLPYRPCKRLEMLFSNIKAVYYALSGQDKEACKETEKHLHISSCLGPDYQRVAKLNLQNSFSTRVTFAINGVIDHTALQIDPRIW